MDFSKVRHLIFFGFLGLVTLAFLYMIRPFAYPIFWAAIIAGIFYPLHKRLNVFLAQRTLSSIIVLILVIIIIILPLSLISTLLVKESIDIYASIDSNRGAIYSNLQNALGWVKHNAASAGLNINEQFWLDKFSEITKTVVNFIFISIKSLTQNSLSFLAKLIIMFYALFFFIRDGEKMLKFLMHLCPLGDKYEKMLYKKFTSTASATLKGTFIVGIIQGTLGGLLFGVAGIQGAFIWGLIMAALSVIPPLSSTIVWLPTGIVLIAVGKIWTGILIIAFGTLVIATVDNFLRPILIGRDTQMHPVLILFSTLGGIILFGISGFIVGPIITALFLAFWEMYEHYYQSELSKNNEDGL